MKIEAKIGCKFLQNLETEDVNLPRKVYTNDEFDEFA